MLPNKFFLKDTFVKNYESMSKQRFFIVGIILILFQKISFAQEATIHLAKTQLIEAVIANNKTIKIAQADEAIATSKYKLTDAVFLPQVAFSYSTFNTNNPLNAFGFKLQQKSITTSDFNPDVLNNPKPTSDFSTKLEVKQPLLNMDLLYQRKGAAKQIDLYKYKQERTKEYIAFEAEKAYLQLQLLYKSVTVLEEAKQTIEAVLLVTENYFKQGLIQKSDVLNVQIEQATLEYNLIKAKSEIKTTSDYISVLMGNSLGKIYTVDEEKSKEQLEIENQYNINKRADFLAMQTAIEATDLLIKSSKMSYLPKLNAFGSIQLNDNRLLGFGANSYLLGVQLSWDIFKGNSTKNTIIVQTQERNKLTTQLTQQKEQANFEIEKCKQEIKETTANINVHKITIKQADEALRILQNRYEQGLAKTSDVMMAASQLSQKKFALAQNIFMLNVNNAYLHFLTTSTK